MASSRENARSFPHHDKVYVYRKQNGEIWADPSPALLGRGETLTIKNLAGGTIEIDTLDAPLQVRGPNPFEHTTTVHVNRDAPDGFYEYEMARKKGKGRRKRVKGGSRPGVIIDG